MRRFLLMLIVALLGATFLRGWQTSPAAIQSSACVDVPANPDYLVSNSEQDAIAAINNARAGEGLPALRLPGNFYQLDPARQQFVLINLERTDRGLKPLGMDANLARIAHNYSRQMRDLHFFSHTSPIGGTFSERINSNGLLSGHYALAAENLAGNPVAGAGAVYEYMYDDSVEACGHRANILDPQVTLVGIGWVPGSNYGSISAQEFIGSASWNPYHGVLLAAQTPGISITGGTRLIASSPTASVAIAPASQQDARNINQNQWIRGRGGDRPGLVSFHAHLQPNISNARITWFLDRPGNLPFNGADMTLDLNALAPGKHTLLVYAVDGQQNYSMAAYVMVI